MLTASRSLPVHIRWAIRRDMPEMLTIESSLPDPWPEDTILHLLRQRNMIGMVAERDDKIVGYMIYALHKTRIHLERAAVHPDFRGKGVFRQMVRKLQGKLSPQRRVSITAIVDERNLDLLLAMKACGFVAFGLIPDHFDDADGVDMKLTLDAVRA